MLIKLKYFVVLLSLFYLAACTNLLFQPAKRFFYTPDIVNVEYEDIFINSNENIRLHGWRLKTQNEKKGNILYLHGNGENISTHFANLYWLTDYGYDGYIFDYRGYGRSDGNAELEGVIHDTDSMLNYVINQTQENETVYIIGHSLGGALAIFAVAHSDLKSKISSLITIESFSDYRDITQDVLSMSWLTWLFQWPLSYTINNDYSPVDVIEKVSPVPLLVMHSRRDLMIDFTHADRLYNAALEPKQLIEIDSDHNQIFNEVGNRQLLLEYLSKFEKD